MTKNGDVRLLRARRKAINSLFPYVLWQDRVGQQEMLDAISFAAAVSCKWSRFTWNRIKPYITQLSKKRKPRSQNLVFVLASPHISWSNGLYDKNTVTGWAEAALQFPYDEILGWTLVDALFQITSVDSLWPHIPVGIWARLKKQPTLPYRCSGRSNGTKGDVVRHVRALGDIQVFRSYLVLVWSEWDPIRPDGFGEMCISIREDFSGIGMGRHREDLIKRLDYVLERLSYVTWCEPSLDGIDIQRAKEQYGELKNVLLEVDREAMDILARTPLGLIPFTQSTDIHEHSQNLTRPSCALCLSHAHNLFETLDDASTNVWLIPRLLSHCYVSLHSPRRLRTSQICATRLLESLIPCPHFVYIILVEQEFFTSFVFSFMILFVKRSLSGGIAVSLEHCHSSGNFGPPFTLATA